MKLYAYRIDFADAEQLTVECDSLNEAREACTTVMEANEQHKEGVGKMYPGLKRTRISLLVRDAGEFKATWSREL